MKGYIGPDRRKARSMRLVNRRKDDLSGPPPSIATALRQLRIKVFETDSPAGMKDFIERCRAVAILANEANERPVANVIMDMARKLEKVNGQDVRDKIYPILDRAVGVLSGNSGAR
jgi:hypothetical protein